MTRSTLTVLGFATETGRSAPFTAAQRALASRIEAHDRDVFAHVHRQYGRHVNLICRDFLPGEHRIQRAMGSPIRPSHVVMALVLDTTGYIDRKPIGPERLKALAAELAAGGR